MAAGGGAVVRHNRNDLEVRTFTVYLIRSRLDAGVRQQQMALQRQYGAKNVVLPLLAPPVPHSRLGHCIRERNSNCDRTDSRQKRTALVASVATRVGLPARGYQPGCRYGASESRRRSAGRHHRKPTTAAEWHTEYPVRLAGRRRRGRCRPRDDRGCCRARAHERSGTSRDRDRPESHDECLRLRQQHLASAGSFGDAVH